MKINVQLIGYFFNETNEKLLKLIEVMWKEAEENVKRKIEVLNKENVEIDMNLLKRFVLKRYPNYPQKQIGATVMRQYVEETLNIGISGGEYIYRVLEKYKVGLINYHSIEEVMDVFKSAEAKVFIAHPAYYIFRNIKPVRDIEAMIDVLAGTGAVGVEAYTPLNPPYYRVHFANYARNKGLLVSAGSNFQGRDMKNNTIGAMEYPEWVKDGLDNNFFINYKDPWEGER